MGSYTSSQLVTPVRRMILNGSAAVGDNVIITLNGADVTYTVKPGDVDINGFISTPFAAAMAAAINASTVIDPVSKLPINEVFCAASGIGEAPIVRVQIWCLISTYPAYDHAFTLATRYVPIHAGGYSPVQAILTAPANAFVTVTDTIPTGSVLTTQVTVHSTPGTSVTESYVVTSGDSAVSIASHIATQLVTARPNQIKVAQSGNSVVIFNTETAGSLTFATSLTPPVTTEKATLYVSGRFLYDRRGNQAVLRGVDYPLADDGNFPGGDYLSEIVQTGANAVRIQWYISYSEPTDPSRPPLLTPEALGGFIDKCIAAKIVPIVMISDDTSNGTSSAVNTDIVPWWTSAEVKAVMLARQQYLIVNIANELGFVRWSGDANASDEYIGAYKEAIGSMRAAGYTCPLMIDAPDDGTTIDEFTSHGAELVAADPLGNILLSVHAYWAGYDGRPYIPTAVAANLPIVFGEIANFEDEVADDGSTEYGYYALDGTGVPHPPNSSFTYQGLLTTLQADQIGWLAWSWYNDLCPARQMTETGRFSGLSPYGNDLVNNPVYGFRNPTNPVKPILP